MQRTIFLNIMNMLYPLKFRPRMKKMIWGSEKWEFSGVEGDISVAGNGFLKNNNLQELIEVYMGELVGDSVYNKYGIEFPVLVKLIDARDVLSIQVHPDDRLAAKRHRAYGKAEMWYVVDCEPGASIYVGFNRKVSREEYLDAVAAGTLPALLNKVAVKPGDAYYIPAGTIHSIGAGILIAEIEQTSDITYRIYDWGRTDEEGMPRELHTELAADAIDFGAPQDYDITRTPVVNAAVELKQCPYFTTNLIELDGAIVRDYMSLESFVIYMCVEGEFTVQGEKVVRGESILLPAVIDTATLEGRARLLEVYIEI